jgi:sugar lactone lactonase YvrE
MVSVEIAVDANNHVGESPIWDAEEQALYWVDIIGKTISRYDPAGGDIQHWSTGDFPTAIALLERGHGAVLALANGVHLFDFADNMQQLSTPDTRAGNRLNEGKCDPGGRFWVGSMQTNLNADGTGRKITANTGALFRIDADGSSKRFSEFEFGISNTMAWTQEKRYFYFGDSIRNVLFRFDYDNDTGRVGNPKLFFECSNLGALDGSCIDDDGCIWNARFGAGKLIRITPQGDIDCKIDLPVTNPTSCTFGGSNGRILFVTSARFTLSDEHLAANPNEGALLALDVGISGPSDRRFAGSFD